MSERLWVPNALKEKTSEWKGAVYLRKFKFDKQLELARKYSVPTELNFKGTADTADLMQTLADFARETVSRLELENKKTGEKVIDIEDALDCGEFHFLLNDTYQEVLKGLFASKK